MARNPRPPQQPADQPPGITPVASAARPRPAAGSGGVWSGVAGVAVAWALIAVVDVVLIFTLDNHVSGLDRQNPAQPRFAAFEVAAAAAWATGFGLAAAVTLWLAGRIHPRLAAAVPAVAVAAVAGAFAVSWGAFWAGGTFVDRGAIAFLFQLVHPLRPLTSVSPWLSVGVPAGALAAAGLGTWTVGRALRAMGRRGVRLVAVGGLVLATATVVYAASADVADTGRSRGRAAGPTELLSDFHTDQNRMWELLRYRCGPCATALLDLTGMDAAFTSTPRVSPGVAVIFRPRVTMGDYLAGVDRPAVRPLNVLVIEIESMRADALRVYGGRRPVMPAVDALAAESVVFAQAHTQATHSNYAVPGPLSGQYPLRSSVIYRYPDHPAHPPVMLYDVLKASGGYGVGLFSSGNEHWYNVVAILKTPAVDAYQDEETWAGPGRASADAPTGDDDFARWIRQTRTAGIVDDRYTVDTAVRWIDGRPGGQPFFAYLNLQCSHFPYWVGPNLARAYSPAQPEFHQEFQQYAPAHAVALRDRYDDSLRYVDAQLGRLFDHLRATGAWDRTVVVLTGDHGEAFFEHGFPSHGNVPMAEVARVPLLIRAPGLAPRVDPYLAQHVDVPPSVLHLLGLPPHPAFQGLDLFAADRPPHRSAFVMAQTEVAEGYALVRDGYKLLYDQRVDGYALFDESTDPGDRDDVIATHPDLAARMADRLNTWRAVQLAYYNSPLHQAETFPPVLPDQ